jgi:phage gp16-like protein
MTPAQAADIRRRELAQIHLAKKQLGMDDDAYRDLLFTVARVRSAADLDWTGRKRVLDHFVKCGYKQGPAGKRWTDPTERKVRSLWLELRDAGALRDASDAALFAFCKRTTGADHLRFANGKELRTIIESLKLWLRRELQRAENTASQ